MPCSPILDMAQVLAHPHVAARSMCVPGNGADAPPTVANPMLFDGQRPTACGRFAAPGAGQTPRSACLAHACGLMEMGGVFHRQHLEPSIFIVRPDRTLYCGATQTMPFAPLPPHIAYIQCTYDQV